MFSAWDFNSWILSVGVMLSLVGLLTGLSALVSVVVSRIWGEVRDDAATARMSKTPEKPPIRKAA